MQRALVKQAEMIFPKFLYETPIVVNVGERKGQWFAVVWVLQFFEPFKHCIV
jgi:hypothetical protein